MENNAVIKNGVGNISQAELAAMKEQMNHKALVRRRTKTALRLAANIMVGAVILLPLLRFIGNSFLVASLITIGQIITCSLAAFAFSFLDFKGKGILFMVVMATMMVPGEATIISNYLTMSQLKMLDTYQVLIIPYLTSATGIFLFRQFYMTFPISLYEQSIPSSMLGTCICGHFL